MIDAGKTNGPSKPAHPSRWPDVAALAGLTVLFLIANFRPILGIGYPNFDADGFFAPYFMLIADHARAGELLVWDPWTNGGVPACAYPEIGSFSPLTVAFAWLAGPNIKGFIAYWLFLWWIGGVGMYALTRHLNAPPWGAFAAGMGFLFCGFATGHTEHTSWLTSFMFLPLLIWRLDVALTSKRLMPAMQAGAIWGLSALSGYPGVVLSNTLVAGLWVLGSWRLGPIANARSARVSLSWGVAVLAGVLVVGLGVASPAWLDFAIETRGYTERSGAVPRELAVADNCLQPHCLLTFSTPHASTWRLLSVFDLSNPVWSGTTDASSWSIYVATPVLWLAVVGLALAPRDRWSWWLVAVAALGLGLALGSTLPLRGWFYDLVPPSRYFRHASLFASITMFSLCVLAGLGSRRLADLLAPPERPSERPSEEGERNGRDGRRIVIVSAILPVAGLAAFFLLLRTLPSDHAIPEVAIAKLHAFVMGGAILGLGLIAAWGRGRPRGSFCVVGAFLAILCFEIVAISFLTRKISLYGPAVGDTWNELKAIAEPSLDLTEKAGWDRDLKPTYGPFITNKHLLVRTSLLKAFSSMSNRHYQAMLDDGVLSLVAQQTPRLWFAAEAIECSPTSAAYRPFTERAKAKGEVVAIVHPRPTMFADNPEDDRDGVEIDRRIHAAKPAQRLEAKLTKYRPTALAFAVDAPEDGWLIVTDRWVPGWRASVNGTPVDPAGGLFLFRAVPIKAGHNEVSFQYRPFGQPWLAIASWAILGITLVLVPLACRRG